MNEDKANDKNILDAAGAPKNRAPGPYVSDEEFAERIYEDEAPIAPQFAEKHEISATGRKLRPGGYASGIDTPSAEES